MIFPRFTYLDHNATTPVAPEVRRAMAQCLKKDFGNASSLHTAGREARGLVENARASVAGLLGCEPTQIFFTSGGTEANNTVIKGVLLAAGRKGHIVTSKIEHESILGACKQVEQLGCQVTYVPAGRDGRVSAADVRNAVRRETILISIMHANNETGAIQPVSEIGRIAREMGVPFHTDAVQSFGKIPVQVDDIGCEFLTISAHKINGPKGIGALYWRGNAKWFLQQFGGNQERELRAGTEAVHQIVGFGIAADIAANRMKQEFARLTKLRAIVIEGMRRLYPQVRINEATPTDQLPGTVNSTFPGKSGLELLAGLDCYRVAVSIGSACTADRTEPSHVLLGMGHTSEEALSAIRISMGTTTTARDVRCFLRALAKALRGAPPGFSWLDPKHLTAERILLPNTLLIDVRYPLERALSPSIPGARLWSHIGFERHFGEIPRDREVILMCTTGILSLGAGYRLAAAGHPAVRVVYGGYAAWRALHPDLIEKLKAK